MAAKRFHIARPDQLRMLAFYAKETPNNTLTRIASVWQAALRRNEKTRWDNAIYADFCGTRAKHAEVVRFNADHEIVSCGELRYHLALNWCEQNLQQVCN